MGTFSLGLQMTVFPITKAIGKVHMGTITVKGREREIVQSYIIREAFIDTKYI